VVIPNSTNSNAITVTLTNGTSTNNNFAEVKPASLSGFVYVDANENGVMDSGEPGIPGVAMRLTGTNDLGTIAALTTTTAADGSYSFGALRPGSYTVTEANQPAGYVEGAKSQNTVIVANAAAPDIISNITLVPAASSSRNNFGKLRASSLSGHVYLTLNNNSRTGFGGIAITLTGSNDLGTIAPIRVTTLADGSYSFGNLRPGTYTITESPPPGGYIQGASALGTLAGAAPGTSPGKVVGNTQFQVTVGQGVAGVNYDFNELLPPATPQVIPPVAPPPSQLGKILFVGTTMWIRR
jgi:hypothetical protein